MWTEIRLPAIAEDNDPIDRKPGEALCPERFNIKELLKIRDQIGPQLFDAMYQQNPSTPGTQIFKRDWWRFYRKENHPDFGVIIQSWDYLGVFCKFGTTLAGQADKQISGHPPAAFGTGQQDAGDNDR